MILTVTSSVRFTASISRSQLTVADVLYGAMQQGQLLQDAAGVVIPGTRLVGSLNVPGNGGGPGLYTVSIEQSVPLAMMMSGGLEVLRGQANRVPEPLEEDFCVITPMRQARLAWNETAVGDDVFQGSINGNILTVLSMTRAAVPLVSGLLLRDVNGILPPGTVLGPQLTGTPPGGVGTYIVGPDQTMDPMQMLAGVREDLVPTKLTVQVDVHGPASGDNTKIIEGLLYSEYGFDAITAATAFGVAPLSISDPIQAPFINQEQQYEYRWTMDVDLQIDPVITTPQDFADRIAPTIVPVDIFYPIR
jgi:hypothetical protein